MLGVNHNQQIVVEMRNLDSRMLCQDVGELLEGSCVAQGDFVDHAASSELEKQTGEQNGRIYKEIRNIVSIP